MSDSTLLEIRGAELDFVRRYFPPSTSVLDIGGGTGLQAGIMASWGCRVRSIEVEISPEQHFPVELYDGRILPFVRGQFDIVYSSNVLEHVEALEGLIAEMGRVLKPSGLMIHIVPSASWRWWTSLAHYPYLIKRGFNFLSSRLTGGDVPAPPRPPRATQKKSAWLLKVLRSDVHGVRGKSPFAELALFSRWGWRRRLRSAGLNIAGEYRAGVWYTGYCLSPSLAMPTRKALARLLGSSCHVFVVTPANRSERESADLG